jgi:hypothetical protein
MPFILRPCKDSLRVIFYYGQEETEKMRYFFSLLLFVCMVVNSMVCVSAGLNLEDVLTLISTLTSPLVLFAFNVDVLHSAFSVLHEDDERNGKEKTSSFEDCVRRTCLSVFSVLVVLVRCNNL